jgi:asparagine synthase (glutamine-hydrolysing)
LRDWAESLLAADRLKTEGYFQPRVLRRTWRDFLAGKRQWQGNLWTVLMFQAWLEAQRTPETGVRP